MANETRRLKPGAARMKAELNSSRPRIVSTGNLFGNSTARPRLDTTEGVRPPVVPVSSMFSGPSKSSPFNMSPNALSLLSRQEVAFKNSQSGNYVMPMMGGKRTRKHSQKRKKSKRKN